MGADKTTPPEDSHPYQAGGHDSVLLIWGSGCLVRGRTEHWLGISTGFESWLQTLPRSDTGQDGPPAVSQAPRLQRRALLSIWMDSEHSPSVPCGGAEAWEAEVSQGMLSGEDELAGPWEETFP